MILVRNKGYEFTLGSDNSISFARIFDYSQGDYFSDKLSDKNNSLILYINKYNGRGIVRVNVVYETTNDYLVCENIDDYFLVSKKSILIESVSYTQLNINYLKNDKII